MIEPVREWFPDGALSLGRIAGALRDGLEVWRNDWMSQAARPIGVRQPALMPAHVMEVATQHAGARVQLALSAPGKRHLLEGILDETLAGKELTVADHRLLDDLADRATNNLVECLDRLLGTVPADTRETGQIGISIDNQEIYRLTYPLGGMIALVRNGLGESQKFRPPFETRRVALGPCKVRIEALLGSVDLTIDDLRDLAPGDVLILDRKLDRSADVRLHHGGHAVGQGRPTVIETCNAIAF